MSGDLVGAPAWSERAYAVLDYLGAAPFTHRWRRRGGSEFGVGHHTHALGLMLLLAGVGLLYVLGIAIVTIAIMSDRMWYEKFHIEGEVLGALRKFFLAWGVFWIFAIGTAVLGREAYLPGVWRLARRPRLMRVTAWCWGFLIVFVASGLSFAAYAGSKVRQDPAPGKVYLLYENGDRFPRWLFALGFYPMAVAAEERYGPGNVVMLRVSTDSLRRSLREATFLFLGTHGMHQGILVPEGFFKVEDVKQGETNPGLQFVYMSGCDQGSGWENAFAPARVVTYDRLTSVVEHVWWMWFDGPGVIRALK